jgi:hypothetical protein
MSGLSKGQVKALIQSKFESLRRFCYLTGRASEYGALRVFLNRDAEIIRNDWQSKKLTELYISAMSTPNDYADDEISRLARRELKERIKAKYGSLSGFLRDYPHFARSTVKDVLNGRTKRKNEVYNRLLIILE